MFKNKDGRILLLSFCSYIIRELPGLIVLKIMVQFIFISFVFSLKDLSVKSFVQLKLRLIKSFFQWKNLFFKKFAFQNRTFSKETIVFFKIFLKTLSFSLKLSFSFIRFKLFLHVLCFFLKTDCFLFLRTIQVVRPSLVFFLNNTIIHKTFS